jgi:hypothetical protein
VTGRALREEYEALQAREKRVREALAASEPSLHEEEARLSQELDWLERTLEQREERAARQLARRPVSQRVAAFGFDVLFVVPIVSMLGITIGRRLRNEVEFSVLLLAVGLLIIALWVIRPVRTALLRLLSPEWRFVRRARRLSRTNDSA